MGLLVLGIAFSTLWGVRYDSDKNSFMSIEDTTFLRGFWCIIVVLVHVPAAYQNRIQDMIGSFAFIGVTFFFMTSAYGLKYVVAHKENYLRGFWIKRLPAILVPVLLSNVVIAAMKMLQGNHVSILSFFYVNDWVKVLLFFYLVFWIVYYVTDKMKIRGGYWKDVLICLVVIAYSLICQLSSQRITWGRAPESLGFVYGILAANCIDQLKEWTGSPQWVKKSVLLFLLGGITGVAYLKFKPVEFFGSYCLKVALGVVLLLLILQLTRRMRIGNKVMAFLGGISYEVYLLHGAVFTLLAEVAVIKTRVYLSGVLWLSR